MFTSQIENLKEVIAGNDDKTGEIEFQLDSCNIELEVLKDDNVSLKQEL